MSRSHTACSRRQHKLAGIQLKLGGAAASFVLDFEIDCRVLQDQTPLHPLPGFGLFPSPPLLARRCYQTKPTRSRSGLLDQLGTTRSTEPSTITLSRPSGSTKHHNINLTRCSQTNTQSLIHGMVEHACNVRGNMVKPHVYESSCVPYVYDSSPHGPITTLQC